MRIRTTKHELIITPGTPELQQPLHSTLPRVYFVLILILFYFFLCNQVLIYADTDPR